MTNQKNNKQSAKRERDTYLGVGIIFLCVGVVLSILGLSTSSALGASGLPFFILGVTFIALAQQDGTVNPKK